MRTRTRRLGRHARVGGALPLLGLGVSLACGPRTLPPLGEALVVVDTDGAVPRVVSRLRIDTYAADGAWLDARETTLPDVRDWPASFSVQAKDDTRVREVLVRIRGFGERTRTYRGAARLVLGGVDTTPPQEPEPSLAIDRIVRLRLVPGERGRAVVVLRSACAGVPSELGEGGAKGRTCVVPSGSEDGRMEDVGGLDLEPTMDVPRESLVGTAARTPCPAPSDASRVCLEGSSFVLGRDEVAVVPDPRLPLSPERVVRVTSFVMDRDEVTVARYREALARGFVAPEPVGATEGPLGDTAATTCSFSTAPLGRESFGLSCVPWATARAFCRDAGGDLPTEAEWEYAATSANRPGKVEFPWGDDTPTCADAIYGRLPLAGFPGACEATSGRGPRPVDDGGAGSRDLTPGGVRGLAGGLGEWTRDAPSRYDGPCWSRARAADPSCEGEATSPHVVRGGAWAGTPISLRGTGRLEGTQPSAFVGFRCVYRGPR